jgi:hypothetical protein
MPFAIFGLLAFVSWNRWIEPYIDTGRELMVPWRLAHGERLYGGVHFHHGPLGPYLAAVVDAVFGRSLPARTGLYALVALLHVAGLGVISRRLMPAWRAALAVCAAIATAVFLRPGGWMFPFSFDTGLAVAALTWALVLAAWTQDRAGDLGAGVCLLAALLARPELGLAGIVVFAAAARRSPRRLVPLAAAPLAAAASGYALISAGIPFDRLVSDGWLRMLDPPEAFRNVYRAYAGLDRPGLRLTELALAAMILTLFAAILVTAAFAASRARGRGAAIGIGTISIGLVAAAAAVRFRPPDSMAERLWLLPPLVRVIPPCLVAAAALRFVAVLRPRGLRGPLAGVPDAVLWMSALFSARLLLAAGYVGPYNAFFLPLPVVVAVAGLFGLADRMAPAAGRMLPALTAAALSVFLGFRILATGDVYRGNPWESVSTPAGSLFLPEPVAGATAAALERLGRLPPGAAVAGFPETGFFNYALGLRNPFWLEQFFPGHLDPAGEARAIAVLDASPPDAVVLANVLAVGEGSRAFGEDYLPRLAASVRERYATAALFGPGAHPGARIGDPAFFVEIATPRPPPAGIRP